MKRLTLHSLTERVGEREMSEGRSWDLQSRRASSAVVPGRGVVDGYHV